MLALEFSLASFKDAALDHLGSGVPVLFSTGTSTVSSPQCCHCSGRGSHTKDCPFNSDNASESKK
ncbi:hypothetical protein ABKN59_005032 [Abortiporus biennis]